MEKTGEKTPVTVPRRKHFWYVMIFSVLACLSLAVLLSCIFPYYSDVIRVIDYININLLWFLPAGIIFGVAFGIVLNRYMLVAYSPGPAENVPLSWAARYGRRFRGWRAAVSILVLLVIAFGWGAVRPIYYRTPIFGWVPGLSRWQPVEVKFATCEHFRRNRSSPAVIPAIIFLMKHDESDAVREIAARVLGIIGDERAFEPLLEMLVLESNVFVRAEAAGALGKFNNPDAVESLIKSLQHDKSGNVRAAAAGALGQLGDKRALAALCHALLNEKNLLIRELSAQALGRIGDRRALPALIRVRETTSDGRLRLTAAEAVNQIAAQQTGGQGDSYK